MLHSVGDENNKYDISIELFEHLLIKLQKERVVHLDNWENVQDFIALSFDDVPSSFYFNAFPLLKRYNIPFTIFVSCSLLDTDGYISAKMLSEISASELCTVGSHGLNHSFYKDFSKEDAKYDLRDSKRRLEEMTGRSIGLFAFPYGSFYACGLNNKKCVLEYYKYGFSTLKTNITRPILFPKYFLPRINVDEAVISRL